MRKLRLIWLRIRYPRKPPPLGKFLGRKVSREFARNMCLLAPRSAKNTTFILASSEPSSIRRGSFAWSDSPEGGTYWAHYSIEWSDFLRRHYADSI